MITLSYLKTYYDFPFIQKTNRIYKSQTYLTYIIPIERVKDAKLVKEWLGVDTMFKVKNRDYWFCEEIQEADWEYV